MSQKLHSWFIPPKVSIETSLLLENHWIKTLSTLVVYWNREIAISTISFTLIIWTHLDFQARFFPKTLTRVLSSRSQSLVFYFCWIVPLKIITFHPFSEVLSNQNWQKLLIVLTCGSVLDFVQLQMWRENDEVVQTHPGRTFLGKRRYFSGIAALTPLTPLTYKQNAVNAFIPTKKTPLTPLFFRLITASVANFDRR